MELEFEKYMNVSIYGLSSTDTISKDSFFIFNASITYRICLGDEKGEGYITLRDNYNENQKKKSLHIEYDSEYTNFKNKYSTPCEYYDFLEINSTDTRKTIEIQKKSITSKKIL